MSNNVIYAKEVVLGLNRFHSGHFQNTQNMKTFFDYAYFALGKFFGRCQNFSSGNHTSSHSVESLSMFLLKILENEALKFATTCFRKSLKLCFHS